MNSIDTVYSHLSNAYGRNHFDIDKPFQTILKYFLNRDVNLSSLGEYVGRDVYELADYIDKNSNPIHIMWSINGERVDAVWLDPAQRWVINKLVKGI